MSDYGHFQNLALPGLICALLVLGAGPDRKAAFADELHRSAASLALGKIVLAQAADPSADPSGTIPPDGSEISIEAPFSELNEALTAARSRLTELTKAAEIAKVVGELQEKLQLTEAENQQLKAVLGQLQTENSEILSSKQITDQRAVELEKAAAEASTEVQRLSDELTSLRQENTELGGELANAEAEAGEAAGEVETLRSQLNAQAESLSAVAEDTAAEIARLQGDLDTAQGELDKTKGQLAAAESERTASAAELASLRKAAEDKTSTTAKLEQDLDTTIAELGEARTELQATQAAFDQAKTALEASDQETGALREQVNASVLENDQLRGQLASAEIDLDRFRALNTGLEQQVTLLKTAAGEATDAARQNLLAVEKQINEINAALASVKAEELLQVTEQGSNGAGGPSSAADQVAAASESGISGTPASSGAGAVESWVPRPSPPRVNEERRLIAASVSDDAETREAANLLAATATSASGARASGESGRQPAVELASLAADLPANRREEAAALLAELKAEQDPRGLSMTVPGADLFAVDSEQIEPTAIDTLSSVAELVDLYDGRDVLIVGHTDAVGDAGYNQQLSERRAALVKAFFVENFDVEDARVQIEGKGEQSPISTNATVEGRDANRRVEVIILN